MGVGPREGADMTSKRPGWRTWVAGVIGFLMMLKSLIFVGRRVVAIAKEEFRGRGSDVNLVLGLADRHRGGR